MKYLLLYEYNHRPAFAYKEVIDKKELKEIVDKYTDFYNRDKMRVIEIKEDTLKTLKEVL